MINKSFQNIEQEDIESLVKNRIPESRTLDYKQGLPNNSWQSEIEFLQDVSAFANASGGDLVFGIEEEVIDGKKTGIPKDLVDLRIGSLDEAKRRLNSLVRSGIEPPLSVQINHFDGLPRGPVLIIRVPASWAAPHMITLYRRDILKPQFYIRHNVENLPMDIDEIRSTFNLSENRIQRLRRFRQERVSLITSKDPVVPHVHEGGVGVILHLLPMNASDPTAAINLKILQNRQWPNSPGFPHGGRRFVKPGFNFDGFLIQTIDNYEKSIIQYVQIFRTGALEVVRMSMAREQIEDFENVTIRRVRDYLKIQRDLEVQLPIVAMLTIWGAKGLYVIPPPLLRRGAPNPIDRDLLPLPECIIDDFDRSLTEILRLAFDALYQDTGLAGCPSYDENAKWIGEKLE